MQLCSNRPEGFGPASHLYAHVTTSCFNDTVLVPLATWIYLLLLVFVLLASTMVARRNGYSASTTSTKPTVQRTGPGDPTHAGRRAPLWKQLLYAFLIVAVLAMVSLEIARLEAAKLGIGLLPFTYVGVVLATVVQWRLVWRPRQDSQRQLVPRWRTVNTTLWVLLAVTNAVKIAQMTEQGVGSRKGTPYPMSDEIIDVSVMVGLYVVLGILEWF